jgi:hypothetical protein
MAADMSEECQCLEHLIAQAIPSRTYGSACGHSSAEGGAVLRCEKWQREWQVQVASGKWRWRRAESGAVLVCINRLIGAG